MSKLKGEEGHTNDAEGLALIRKPRGDYFWLSNYFHLLFS